MMWPIQARSHTLEPLSCTASQRRLVRLTMYCAFIFALFSLIDILRSRDKTFSFERAIQPFLRHAVAVQHMLVLIFKRSRQSNDVVWSHSENIACCFCCSAENYQQKYVLTSLCNILRCLHLPVSRNGYSGHLCVWWWHLVKNKQNLNSSVKYAWWYIVKERIVARSMQKLVLRRQFMVASYREIYWQASKSAGYAISWDQFSYFQK